MINIADDLTPYDILYLISTGQWEDLVLSEEMEILVLLEAMDHVAIKAAGAEHLVHWDISKSIH